MSEADGSPLFAAIARHAEERPDAIAVRHPPPYEGYDQWSWRLLRQDAEYIAAILPEAVLYHGTLHVGWLQQNHPHALTTLLACALAGYPYVPLNWRLTEEELRRIEADCGVHVVLGHCSDRAGHADIPFGIAHPYRDGLNADGRPVGLDAENLAAGLCARSVWNELESRAAAVDHATPLIIAYTSGTTGRPKGAVLTQGAVMANITHAQSLFGLTPEDRVLTVLPLFHLGGLCIQTLPALVAGAQVILHPRFQADAFFDALERDRPTQTLLVPTIMHALVTHPRWPSTDLSSLRTIGAGSSDVPPELIAAFHARGVPVQQVYGLTESGPIAIAQSREEALAAPGSIGRPVGACEARIAGADGTAAATDEPGEIQLCGPNLFAGYWNDDALTREAFTGDGWFRTGDVGRRDAQGRFWFTDRLKHVIISGGENIYPAELERVLLTAPGIVDGAVCGRPDARWGEVPVAVVVTGEGFDRAAVLRHFEGRLARFKHPRDIVAVPSLPRTALGKIQLGLLRALAAGPSAGR
jgi:fatty-acyl-CoA synthase